MSLRNVSIRTRLVAAFATLTLFVLGLGLAGLSGIATVEERLVDVQTRWLPNVRDAGALDALTGRYTTSLLRHMLTTEPKALAAIEGDIAQRGQAIETGMAAYARGIAQPEERALYETFLREWGAFTATEAPILAHSRAGEKAEALLAYQSKGIGARRNASIALERIIALNTEGAARAEASAAASVARTRFWMVAALGTALALAVAMAVLLIAGIGRGIDRVVRPMQALAEGDLETAIPLQGTRTEMGRVADAVQVFKAALLRMRALESETALARAGAEAQRKAAMRQMADTFERSVGGIVATVTAAATELQATAQSMTATATQTASQSTTVAMAAEEAASNVNTVAAAAEELGSSVLEIGRQVGGSSALAQGAVAEAAQTAAVVQDLSEAAARIGDVVAMISSIAGQTNLLALNATIEAARAGEAGRGFAVVAAEVKELAAQTARATGEIGSQIGRIQDSTRQAVAAIDAIAGRIREISGVSASIAAAVEEQGAATQEIVRNVGEAASGTGAVTANIGGLAAAADETGAAASQVLTSATELSRQSEHLNAEMSRMLASLRAA
ncbi:HAMP domain-containing protein [Methylobacterium sp. WL30]|uniref:methyl-accepting chemotaxis protein n=1 Tax=unclassified Methylobacterium TaxID=2615210 RepID=UPI0011C803E5|nr:MULTISPECIES: methyl-accepting chemotaxis protein [unclassified Methylobacterium]TXN39546.1 HAMP domain-containing protein [Methylobacterium sp. WL93]TXN49422.1 HAMP domain-containing protein [Methylobacterium sp. WL119]TXN63171.1 HAMP domain-containing protein [Methylobacterium sp. WL30]